MSIKTRKGGVLNGILALIGILVVLFAGVGIAMGWIHWSDSPNETNIQIDKTEMQADVHKAVNATEGLIKQSEQAVQSSADQVTQPAQPAASQPMGSK